MDYVPRFAAALSALVLAAACGGPAATHTAAPAAPEPASAPGAEQPAASPLAATAVAGVEDPALRKLLLEHWDWLMASYPVWATTLGDHRYDDRLEDNSPEAIAASWDRLRALLGRARELPRQQMTRGDQLTLDLFIGELEGRAATEVCQEHLWSISARGNPVVEFSTLPERHRVETPADGRNLLARYRAIDASVDHSIAHLREGVRQGLVADAETVRRTVELIERQLAADLASWPLVAPAAAERNGWSAEERARFAEELRAVVGEEIAPAFRRYKDVVAAEVLPRARGAAQAGVGHLPVGGACYTARVREHTGMPLEPEELHRIGLEEIARINGEMVALGGKLFGKRAAPRKRAKGAARLAPVLRILRTDRALYFQSAEEILAAARAALDAANRRVPDFFGRLPEADCVVVPIPDYEAPYTTIAYYREPHFDGSKPGEYFVNTYKPEVRPRFEMQVLSFHEAVPGHHLQIAIGQELPELPAFRRFLGSTAYVEGWALYTERLADEMGLYTGDLDRMGMLSYDAWRASRLVVDTGIHAMGWTRERAERFMREHTALTEENIRNEVDRYISWPGQALAYKVGQREIFRLREEAKKALGDRFDLRAFHDVVLSSGAVTLPVLADNVQRWIDDQQR